MKKLLIFLFAMMLLAGCSSKKTSAGAASTNPPAYDQEGTIDPQWEWLLEEPTGPEATKVVLELTEESLAESLEFYFLINSNQSDAEYINCIAQARSFAVTSFTQEGDVVTAQVTVTVPDVYAIMTAMDLSSYETEEEMEAALCDAIGTATPVQRQITMQFTDAGNYWAPDMDEVAADAFYGGMLTYLVEMMEGVE